MRAFHNDPAIKAKYLERVRKHQADDEIIHGSYWQNGRGCAVGCTIHSGNHAAYEAELGIPRALAYLEDKIFENMVREKSKDWPADFLSAIPVGADLSLVVPKFLFWLLLDPQKGVIRFSNNETRAAIEAVGELYQRQISGEEITREQWQIVAISAASADRAAWAARAARADRAASADRAARAASAAWADWADWAAWAARAAASGQKILELLKEAPAV